MNRSSASFIASRRLAGFPVPVPVRRTLRCHSAAEATHAVRLAQAEVAGDWATALEVMTEVKILKLDLPADAIECAVRTYCGSGLQWERASVLFEGMLSKGLKPTEPTVVAVFEALVVGRQGQKAHLLLQGLEATMSAAELDRSPLYNLVVRALVKEGEMLPAVALLERMVMSDGSLVAQGATYNVVANELMKAGQHSLAEEVLEMRDYL